MLKRTHIAVLVLAAACGGDSFPPESCGTIDDMEILLDEEDGPPPVELCFQDPEGDEITATATSSDPGVVEAVVLGRAEAVELTPVDVGRAVIEVVATDATGASSAPLTFAVTVPNRPPEATGAELPTITLSEGMPVDSLTLTWYFRDPDGHRLAFSAVMSDESVARASVRDSILVIEQLQGGTAAVRVTATDPHGLSASRQAEVDSRLALELLNDQFDALSNRWQKAGHTAAEIVGGRLKLQSTLMAAEGQIASIGQAVSPAENWSVTLNAENVSDDMWAGFVVLTGDQPSGLMVLFGADLTKLLGPDYQKTNFVFAFFDGQTWNVDAEVSLWSDEITNAAQTYTVRMGPGEHGGSMSVLVDDKVIQEIPYTTWSGIFVELPRTVTEVALIGVLTRDFASVKATDAVYFDWVRVAGEPTRAGAAEAAPAAQWERFLHGIGRINR